MDTIVDNSGNQLIDNNIGNQKRKIWLFLLAVFILIIGIFIYLFFLWQKSSTTNLTMSFNPQSVISPTPTSIPFVELTIPYLREKNYESSLGNPEKIAENQSYTSYITSYDSDGLKIYGLLTKPNGVEPSDGWPAIIFIHGYIPPIQYQTRGNNYQAYVDFLAQKGFVVFKIDLRGHGSSEGESSGAYYSSDYVIDTLNAYRALKSQDFINSAKIGLWGHSMAGNIVLRSMVSKPEIPAAVIWAGAVYSYIDLSDYGISDSSYQPPQMNEERVRKREKLRELYGDPSMQSDFWQKVIPINYLKDLKGSLQIHHARNDEVVSIEYSRNLNNILDSTSIKHEFYEYSNGGHNLTGATFNQAMERTVEFFRNNL